MRTPSGIASAPEGVQRLREMIYNLAITGDLTEQLPEDGNAKTLLEEIEQERQRRIKAKEFKRTAKLESEPLDIPTNIKLPDSWEWTRLLDIGEISPRNDAKDDAPAAFISMSGIPQLHKGKLQSELRNWGDIKKGFTPFANGDVVVAKITPCFENGKAAVISGLDNEQGIGAGTTELHVFRPICPEIHPTYIYIFLRSPYFAVEGERNMTGTAGQKRLPTEYFATRALSLPPFAEQARIVAKVDELMALCDKLEVQLKLSAVLSQKLAVATTAAITGIRSEEKEELKVHKTELISKLCLGESPGIKEQAPLAAILAQQNGELAAKDLWQRFGGEIDAFYAQLKLEVSMGWIREPVVAKMRSVEAD
jgi:type I restriction enzyme, S subunit